MKTKSGLLENNPCFIDALNSAIVSHKEEIRWLRMIRKYADPEGKYKHLYK